MKRGAFFLIVLLLFANTLFAGQTKNINKNFKVVAGKAIKFENFSGLKVKITTWERDEVGINLKAFVDCSDSEYETLYKDKLDVTSTTIGSKQIINLEKTNEEAGTSILGLFKIKLFYHFRLEIKGEIFLPKNLSANLDFSYSDIMLSNVPLLNEINGRGNYLVLYDCSGLSKIDNDYGKIRLEKCKGDLQINSRSTNIEVIDHSGDLKVHADYSDIKINNVSGLVGVIDRSGKIEIKNAVVKNLEIPYSELEISDVQPKANKKLFINGTSANFSFYNVKSDVEIKSPYSEARFINFSGDVTFTGQSSTIKGDEFEGNIYIDAAYSTIDFRRTKSKEIKIKDRSNTIGLSLDADPINVEIDNKYGSGIEIILPHGYDGEINVRNRFGKIRSEFELNYVEDASDIYASSKAKSVKKRIKIGSANSDITLKKKS